MMWVFVSPFYIKFLKPQNKRALEKQLEEAREPAKVILALEGEKATTADKNQNGRSFRIMFNDSFSR